MGALSVPEPWSLFQKAAFAAYGTFLYVAKMFFPVGLSAIYPYPPYGIRTLPAEYTAALIAVAILLPVILYACRKNRVVLFGLAFFFIHLALVLQLVTVGTAVMAERYTYLPYIGLFVAVSWWLDDRPSAEDRSSCRSRWSRRGSAPMSGAIPRRSGATRSRSTRGRSLPPTTTVGISIGGRDGSRRRAGTTSRRWP
jgi:hypothetical protein